MKYYTYRTEFRTNFCKPLFGFRKAVGKILSTRSHSITLLELNRPQSLLLMSFCLKYSMRTLSLILMNFLIDLSYQLESSDNLQS